MSIQLLEKMRRLNRILQTAGADSVSFTEIANAISDLTQSNVYVISRRGKILSYAMLDGAECEFMTKDVLPDNKFPEGFLRYITGIVESQANIPNNQGACIINPEIPCKTGYERTTFIPIYGSGERIGTLMMGKYNGDFSIDDLVMAEYAATVVGVEILKAKSDEHETEARKKTVVQMAIGTLSYSEMEAIESIFAELSGNEGLIVASKIADKAGITRSVIVNALRKLESAGVIESRSLGMKGTFLKILNDRFLEELKQYK